MLVNKCSSDAGRAEVESGLDAASPAANAAQHMPAWITSVSHVHGRVERTSSTAGDRLDALSAARYLPAARRRHPLPRRQRYFTEPGRRWRGTLDEW